jgi:Putative Ig domain
MMLSSVRSGCARLRRAGWRRLRLAAAVVLAAGMLATLGVAQADAATTPLAVKTASLPAATVGVSYSAKLAATGGITPYTWSVTQGSLPAGLTLVPTTGLIAGVPAPGSNASFKVQVTDSENPSVTASANLSITVTLIPLAVTTTSLPAASGGVSYSAKLAATGGYPAYTWSVTQGALPAGLSLNASTGAITGKPTAPGTASFTVGVSDAETPPGSASANLSITVNVAPLAITTTVLSGATDDLAYSAKLAASGGIAPYTWSVTAGALPAGLSLNASTGAITGKPTVPGTASFTVKVSDGETPSASVSANLFITVNVAPLAITTGSSLPATQPGVPYSVKLTAAGGIPPYTWSVTAGTLTPGLKLHAATGVISGTPTSENSVATFTVQVSDTENPPASASAAFTLPDGANTVTVTSPGDQLSPLSLAPGPQVSLQVTATDSDSAETLTYTAYGLPPGLQINSATGLITGNVSPAFVQPGTYQVEVRATDGSGVWGRAVFNWTAFETTVTVTSPGDQESVAGAPVSLQIMASDSDPELSLTYSSRTLPAGLTIDSHTGLISGIPTVPGTYHVTVSVVDSTLNAGGSASFTWTVVAPLSATPSAGGPVGSTTVTDTATLAGYSSPTGTITFNLYGPSDTADCTGTAVDTEPVTVNGNGSYTTPAGYTPTAPGTYWWTASYGGDPSNPATSTACGDEQVVITQARPPLVITTTSLPDANHPGIGYSASLAASGGAAPYTWSIVQGALPLGLSLDPATGVISGIPNGCSACNNAYTFTVQVSDSENPAVTATASFTITVTILPLQVIIPPGGSLPGATVGQVYSAVLGASGGVEPYTFFIEQGSLPAGLSLTADGRISGTPTSGGTSTFTVGVGDSSDGDGDVFARLSITVIAPLAITTPSQTVGELEGSSFTFPLAATGGVAPYTWSITSGSLPPGCSLDSAAGVISCNLPVFSGLGSYVFTVTVTDSENPAATASVSEDINVVL